VFRRAGPPKVAGFGLSITCHAVAAERHECAQMGGRSVKGRKGDTYQLSRRGVIGACF
jgi:hypothetical protein